MSLFNKKKSGHYNVLTDNYVPASLPTYEPGLENYVTADYPMNKPESIAAAYREVEKYLEPVVATCDRHSDGTECDHYVDAYIEHVHAVHEAAVANNKNQITRIRSAREMRKDELDRKIISLEEKIVKLKAEIEPLESLRSQFRLRVGHFDVSVGLLVTLAAMIIDAAVNYNFLQTVLLSHSTLLMITVISMSILSDGSMWLLATYLSRRGEKFTSKPLFYIICISLASMFILSVVTSVMIRWGSMDATYGTINAAGEFIGKESYSLAEYGVTLITSFVTTATGLLSFGFSLDEKAFLVSIRENKKKELAKCFATLNPLLNERVLLTNAPDPQEWDTHKCAAAEHQMEAFHRSLQLHSRRQMTIHVNDFDFTERMAKSGEALLREASSADISKIPTTITLNKVS